MSERRSSRRISRTKLTGVVAALACLAFSAVGLKVNEPGQYSYVDGVRDHPVSIERAELTAGAVQVGTRLVDDGGEVKAETTGMFVLVRTTLAVPGAQRVVINRSQLVTRDRTYNSWSSATLSADPGFVETADLVFEVDPQQIDDLTLEIWYGGIVHAYYQRARIHLGITSQNADQWRQAAVHHSIEPERFPTSEALR